MTKLLGGLTCVVTGGAQGIGLATAKVLWSHGANVVVGDIHKEQPDELKQFPERFLYAACDVTNIS